MARQSPSGRDGGPPLTLKALEAGALDYLGRYASSRAHLGAVLRRRVTRAAAAGRVDRAEGFRMVEDLLVRYEAAGLVDDRVYAAQQAASLQRRGVSAQAINLRLRQKGIGAELARAALAELADDGGSDLRAACALVRRRRLGPLRPPAARAAARAKDLGVLARAGFDRALAVRVLACADAAALDRLARAPT